MTPGYGKPLYLLPFDHRHSYLSGMFHMSPPLSSRQRDAVVDTKRVIYEGFRDAVSDGVPSAFAGVLVDEEFGAGVLRDASSKGYVTVMSTEKSGSPEFEFEFGRDFVSHIEAFNPTFAKALVRYNPEGDAALNMRQTARLKQLSDYCRRTDHRFMFELLVPATDDQRKSEPAASAYDVRVRPRLVVQAIRALQEAGVEPDIWKVEGLDSREHCERVVEAAQRGGRDEVGCIVLGRAADEDKVVQWLETAAAVRGFIGFAVGRTTFWTAIEAYVAGYATRAETAARIAQRYRRWVSIYERSAIRANPFEVPLQRRTSRAANGCD
jgi:myo-inositol catabolism protein IolC